MVSVRLRSAPARALRVALVYVGRPEGDGTAWAGAWTAPIGTSVLGSVAADAGHDVELFDSRVHGLDATVEAIEAFDPEVIGVSFLSPGFADATILCSRVRAPGRVLVAGGVHPTVRPHDVLPFVDVVVVGEGEVSFVDLLSAVAAGERPSGVVQGVQWSGLDRLPERRWFDCYEHLYAPDRDHRTYNLQTTRGCLMRCRFCEIGNHAHFPKPAADRFRTADSVLAEVGRVREERGINFLVFVDSIFTTRLDLATEIVERLAVEHSDLPFQFNAHVNKFDESFAVAAAKNASTTAWFGFESGSARMLELMHKDAPLSHAYRAARIAAEAGLDVGANVLLGLPTETSEERDRSVEFIHEIAPAYPNPNIFNPLPGSGFYAYCEERGLLADPDDLHIWLRDEIADRGTGPVHGIDYADVVATYDELLAPAGGEVHPRPWADDAG